MAITVSRLVGLDGQTLAFAYYPNPVKDRLYFSAQDGITNAEVFDITGRRVISLIDNDGISSIDMSALTQGTYMVRVKNQEHTMAFKMLKQ
ncbi:hypothetical protein AM493_05685 [Flavobacterium akiainvivens]|uniref:Secretion system C-terminal sorting domain-containing protein n=1 Tax=Flavobacterium akiainvivens TaxID=1202724 RepID=A0A0N0RQJ2_9FLAO|nr:T9SS type A sorting domain-containing protein [Flavobacterium akiainvivens]KOS05580.1 hypothetical protein AM493_05685 [Flavobacterium akiainvivens]SFQ34718.1 Por secretion system C-terminal sorting domain-containing protein [Flavobacterium akiainvivens]